MPAVFNFTCSVGNRQATKPKNLVARFGDGYSHRVADGINNVVREWDVTFINQPLSVASAIVTFLETAGLGDTALYGNTYFLWTPPDEQTQYKVICEDFSVEYASAISRTITAKFIQVYDI